MKYSFHFPTPHPKSVFPFGNLRALCAFFACPRPSRPVPMLSVGMFSTGVPSVVEAFTTENTEGARRSHRSCGSLERGDFLLYFCNGTQRIAPGSGFRRAVYPADRAPNQGFGCLFRDSSL